MTTKKFIFTVTAKILAFVILSILILTVIRSPIIQNDIYLDQMQPSNEAFLYLELYNRFRPIVDITYACICVAFFLSLSYDTYRFTKTKITEHKENITHD